MKENEQEGWQKIPQNVRDEFEKEIVPGTGSWKDEHGQYNIAGRKLIRNWDSKFRGFMTMFSSFWCGFIALFLWNGSVTDNDVPYESLQVALKDDPTNYLFLIFPVVGFVMAYITIALWINKTTITLGVDTLEIVKGPLPWIASRKSFRVKNIKQCWIEMYSIGSLNDVPVYVFKIMAFRLRGKPVTIESGIKNYYDARILEQWLENHLNIEDKPMQGEYIPGEDVA